MSQDWLIRGRQPVSFDDIVTAVATVAPDCLLRVDSTREWVVLADEQDQAVVWIGLSQYVAAPEAESERLRLETTSDENHWWTEIIRPLWTPQHFAACAENVSRALAENTGAELTEWTIHHRGESPELTPDGNWFRDALVDQITPALALLFSTRPVVTDSPGLREFVRWAHANNRQPVLVTRYDNTELTPAALDALGRLRCLWAVDAGDGLFEGVSGRTLAVDDSGRLVRGGTTHPVVSVSQRACVEVTSVVASTGYAYGNLTLGQFSERVIASVTGERQPIAEAARGSMGVSEPVGQSYDCDVLTEAAAAASPEPTRFLVTVDGGSAHILCVPQPSAVVEQVEVSARVHTVETESPTQQLREWATAMRAAGAGRAALTHGWVSREGNVIPGQSAGIPRAITFAESRFPGLEVWQLLELGGVDVAEGTVTVILPEEREDAEAAWLALTVLLDRHDELTAPDLAE